MIDYSVIKNQIIKNLQIDATSADVDRFQIQESVNAALLTILNILPPQYLTNAIATKTYPLVKNNNLYQLLDDYVKPVNVWIDYSNPITMKNPGRRAIIYGLSGMFVSNPAKLASKLYPVVDPNIEKGIAIYPIPDKTIQNGLRIRYVYKQPDISEKQPCLLDLRLKNILIYLATERAASTEGYDLELADKYAKMAEREIETLTPKVGRKYESNRSHR